MVTQITKTTPDERSLLHDRTVQLELLALILFISFVLWWNW